MSVLDKVQLTESQDRKTGYDPLKVRRRKLADALQDQMNLLLATETGEVFRKVRIKRVRDLETDQLEDVEQKRRVAPWWTVADGGQVHFRLRYGSASLKVKGDHDVIVVPSLSELKKLLPALRREVLDGGLDEALDRAASSLQARFTGRKPKRSGSAA